MTDELKPCPFCGGKMLFRQALWPSDGDIDGIIHDGPSICGIVEFSIGAADRSVIAAWNRRTDHPPQPLDLAAEQASALDAALIKSKASGPPIPMDEILAKAEPAGIVSEADIDAMFGPEMSERLAESMRRDSPVTMGLGQRAEPAGDLVDRVRDVLDAHLYSTHLGVFGMDDAAGAILSLFQPQMEAAEGLLRAMERVNNFIANGIMLGFIRMPDPNVPDPAHQVPGIVRTAIYNARAAGLGRKSHD